MPTSKLSTRFGPLASASRAFALAGLVLSAFFLVASGTASAADWSQFRGPDRHGVSAESGLAPSWSDRAPRELWRKKYGSGFSAVSVVGDRLYTMASN